MDNSKEIFDFIEDIIIEIDKNYQIKDINYASKNLTGKSKEQVLGKKCYSTLFGLTKPCPDCQLTILKENKLSKLIFHDVITFRGFRKIYSAKFTKTSYGNYIEVLKDITDNKKMTDRLNHHLKELKAKNVILNLQKKEIENKKNFLEKILNSTEEGIMVVDSNFNVITSNYKVKMLTDYKEKTIDKCYHIYERDVQCENCPFSDKKLMRSSRKINDKNLTLSFNPFEDYVVESVRDTTKEVMLLDEIKKQQKELQEKQHQMKKLNEDLLKMNDKLQQAQKLIDEELKQVGEIQNSLLPKRLPEIEGFDFGATYIPAEQAGGDYYDCIAMSNGYYGFTVADVSGHGIPAAVIMAITRAIMRSYTYDVISPSEALSMVNEILCENIYTNDFVTMFYLVMNSNTSECKFASAGHNPVLFFDKSELMVKRLTSSGLFLGTFEDIQFEEGAVDLDNGDILFMYTDGLVEAMNKSDEQYGYDRLITKLIMFQNEKCSDIINYIMKDVKEFTEGKVFDDDITIFVVKKED
jgi:sigma-B regulation protein RsbU (phosphoserine phosphatase)